MTKEIVKQRESNFEILRILSMFAIVIWHICVHGLVSYGGAVSNLNKINQFSIELIKSLTAIGVNIYVLISGYFLCKTKFELKRVIRLLVETFVFSFGIYLILIMTNLTSISIKSLLTSFFPVFFGSYWFVTVYLVLYFFTPYLNLIIKNLSKEEYIKLLMFLFTIDCVWQFIYNNQNLGVNFGNGLIHFIFLYYLAAFIREYKYVIRNFEKYKYLLIYLTLSMIVAIISYFADIDRIFSFNSPFIVIMAYCIFMFFRHIRIKQIFINTISKYVFGIYLIHEHTLIRDILWRKLGLVEIIINGSNQWFIMNIFIFGILIFILCWILSYIIFKFINSSIYPLNKKFKLFT